MLSGYTKILIYLSLLACFITSAYAADDTARFYGRWTTSFPFNGQTVTMLSIHGQNGFQNFYVQSSGNIPASHGQFLARDGHWTATASRPNHMGSYRFINNDVVVCTNASGQTITWRREGAPVQPETASGPDGVSAETRAAIAAFDRKDYRAAWQGFMDGAQSGDAEAQAGVGAMLFRHLNPPGTGIYADCERWLLESANHGNVKGMDFLAQYYYARGVAIAGGINPGINTEPIPPALRQQAEGRFVLARQWFERAAQRNDGYAMANLAIMLDSGVGGPRDPGRAAQLRSGVSKHSDTEFAKRATADPGRQAFTAAWQAGHYADALRDAQTRAVRGDANAQALLGRAYYEGVGVARNYAEALRWLNAAVGQNNADAMFFLGLMYEHGRGVRQDIERALGLFDRAASMSQGYARMEAKGMRLQGESNRVAAQIHRNNSVEENACFVAGGISTPGACIRGGENIDPYASWKNESH